MNLSTFLKKKEKSKIIVEKNQGEKSQEMSMIDEYIEQDFKEFSVKDLKFWDEATFQEIFSLTGNFG